MFQGLGFRVWGGVRSRTQLPSMKNEQLPQCPKSSRLPRFLASQWMLPRVRGQHIRLPVTLHLPVLFQIFGTTLYIYVYIIYLEPKWPLFLKVNPPKQSLFQSKQGSFGFQVCILFPQAWFFWLESWWYEPTCLKERIPRWNHPIAIFFHSTRQMNRCFFPLK